MTQGTTSCTRSTRRRTRCCTRSASGVEPDAVAVAPGGTRRQGRRAGGEPRFEHRDPGRPRHLAGGHAHCGGDRAGGHRRLGGGLGRGHRLRGRLRQQHGDADRRRHPAAGRGHCRSAPGPQTIAATPGEVLVGNFGNRTLTAINPTTLQAGGTIALPLNPTGIARRAVGRDGLRLRERSRGPGGRRRPDAWAHRSRCPTSRRGSR